MSKQTKEQVVADKRKFWTGFVVVSIFFVIGMELVT